MNPSPPRISEIPPFKPRISNDWQPTPMDNSNQEFQQLHISAAMNSDLVRRLKNTESMIHRSHDCIVAGSKDESVMKVDSTMKVAPSWSIVAQRSESISSPTGATQTVGSKKSSIDDETKGKFKSTCHSKRPVISNIILFYARFACKQFLLCLVCGYKRNSYDRFS